jgi:hypothetical protein
LNKLFSHQNESQEMKPPPHSRFENHQETKTMKRLTLEKWLTLFMFGIVATANATAGTRMVDLITFGDVASEKSHAFSSANSEIIKGGPGESARKLLPLQPANWQGY